MENIYIEFKSRGYDVDKNGNVYGKNGNILRIGKSRSGYYQINTYKDGKQKTVFLHRVLASKYILNPNHLKEVNHLDGNKTNNSVLNLEWCSRSENIRHGFANNLITPPWKNKTGFLNHSGKTVLQIENDKIIKEFGSVRDAAKQTGICDKTIANVVLGKGKTAGGYYWKYK